MLYCIYRIYTILTKDKSNLIYANLSEEASLNIIISNSSGIPIYEQIKSQIKNMIMTGVLKEGDALPSMRLLAKELKISVITTKRAYEELERDGFIETVVGKGSFIAAKNINFIKEENLKILEKHLNEAVIIARNTGISLQEIHNIINILYGDD